MQNPSDGHHHRRRGSGSGRGNNRGARPPWPGNNNNNNNTATFSHANFPQPYSPQILQRPTPPRPAYVSSAIALERIEAAAARAHAEMVAAGESVSSWKVSQAAAVALQAGSWGALGCGFNDVPTLRNIQSVERKVNAFIHCFVSVRRMTSLYDLHTELCKNEGVEKFEEFGIGSLLRHPLIQQYFSIPPDATEMCEITIDNLLSSLSTFIYKHWSREIPVEEFLDSLLKKYPVARKEYLGVRITSFGLYIGCLKGIRRNESAMLRTFKESSINVITQAESKLFQSDDYSDSLHHLFSFNGESSSKTKNKLQNLSPSIDHMKSFGLAIEKCGESDIKVIQLDARKSAVLELSESDKREFVATWKNECSTHSPNKVLELMSNSFKKKNKRKNLLHLSSSFLGSMLLEIAVKAIKGGFFDHLLNTETETARCTSQDFIKGEIYDEVIIEFIEKWREPCNTRPVYEVIALMLHYYVKSSKKSIQKAFLTAPGSALLNLALEVIKRSPDNSVEGTSISFNEPAKPADSKNEANSEAVPKKEDNRSVTELKNPPDVTVEGILTKINSYFGMDCPFDNDNNGSKNNKDISFMKKLVCRGCEMWLKREFCVEDFLNLGFGNFSDFLDKHIGSLPKELHLLAETNSCNYLEVSLNQKQLHLMLDQAKRSLDGKSHLDKSHVSQILRNQFPSISLNVTETNNTVLNASVCPCSVHFSSTLITLEQAERSSDVSSLSSIGSSKLVSAKDAKECLIKAPFLIDIQLWSHWDSIFKPSLGPLVEWLIHEGYIEGFSCIITRSGCVIRVNDHASFDDLIEAFLHGLPAKVSLVLLSLFVIHNGSNNIPLSLLKYSLQRAVDARIKSGSFLDHKKTLADIASFIIDCLYHLPPEFRSFMAQVMVSILCAFTKDACEIILSQCKKAEKRVMLHEIGLSLGIVEWINDYKEFNAGPMADLDINLNAVSEASKSEVLSLSTVELPGTTIVSEVITTKEMSTEFHEFHGKISSDMTNDEQIQRGNDLIETIRREEFGLDLGASFTESALLKKQHARLGRALQCLSNELYSQDSHFILELVQNADDNNYSAGVEPTLVFILHSNGIVVLNNERGFSDKNIRALCDVGNSTKKGLSSGYIGKKGIGFKSVFRVTDAPEIHSNGFHVKFDITEGQIGFILPTPVAPCDMKYINKQLNDNYQAVGEHWGTCIILPFKPKHKSDNGRTFVLSMFSELHPSLLLFLRNLKCIRFKSTLNGTITTMRKEAGADGVVLISHGEEEMNEMNWLVVNQELDASEIRPEVKTTRISLAFRLNKSNTGDYEPNFDQQPTFAYLPLRKYGMRFILQADFSLPSSREEVDHDSAWNQWLLLKFPDLFVSSLKSFCQLSCFRDSPGKAISTFMSFVPLVGEVHGFFTTLPHMILSKLRVSGCLLQEGFDHEYILPCRALRGWDDNVRSVISDILLQQHAGLGYLKRDIILTDSLAKELSVQEYGPNVLVQILESVCNERDDDINVLGVEWLSAWLHLFYKTLITESSENEHDLLARVKKIPFVPLSDGSFVSITDGPIWVPCNVSSSAIERFQLLYANLRTVSPAIFSCQSDVYSSTGGRIESILVVLHKLGVKQLSAHDVIQSHILKYNFGEAVETEKRLIVEYLSFVFDHFQSPCSECGLEKAEIIEKLKREPIILTNSGFKSPATESIHFSKELGNCISVENLICGTGITWHKVDNIYLKNTNYNVTKWRDFLKDLGVSDFVRLTEVNKNANELGLPVRDWVSHEMDAFVSEISQTGNLKKSKQLLHILDELWDDYFCQKVNEQSESLFIQSSFVKTLREFKWVASSLDNELHSPTELFYKHEAVFSVLGTNVPYAIPKVTSKALLKHLGFKVEVNLDDIVSATQRWKIATSHKASVSQMSKLYSLAWKKTSSLTEKPEHLKSSLYIFLPFINPPDHIESVHGIFLSPSEVYWDDPTGCLDLIKERDHENFQTSTISSLYPDLHDFFVTDCGVLESPPSDKYFDILLQISHVKSPKEAAHGVFRVFLRWANDLKSGKLKSEQLLELINNLVKEENTVLPTIQNKWVSLHPNFGLVCWTESNDLMEEFTDVSDVYFLYFGELTDAERENLSGDVAKFLEEIGVVSLEKVIRRKAIFYDVIDNSEEAHMVNWVLPFAQQYIYNKHPGVYLKLQEVAGEKLSQLNVIAVQRLFYQNTLKENTISSSRSRMMCNCLLEGTTLYVTPDADSHSVILELSRLFFQGIPNLELANFLHSLILMSKVGSTGQQLDLHIKQNQQLLDVPTGEIIWSLKSFTELSADEDYSIPTPLPAVPMHIPQQKHSNSKRIKRELNSSVWPPTSSDAADIYPPQIPTDPKDKDASERDPEKSSDDDCSKMVKLSELMDGIVTMELKDVPTCSQNDMLWSEHQDELQSYRTGRAGELVAYKYFTEMLAGAATVNWVNEAAESGLPYDITVTREDGSVEYIEVKATESGTKNWFIISPGEWDFAKEKGDFFSVAWVVLPNSRKPKVLVLKNPLSLCREKVLNLVLSLTKTGDE